MPNKVAKAYAINDAKIMFVSLVGKAANKHQFLITKSEDGKADFQTYGRILKADAGSHFVTGIVYEPSKSYETGRTHTGRAGAHRDGKERGEACGTEGGYRSAD